MRCATDGFRRPSASPPGPPASPPLTKLQRRPFCSCRPSASAVSSRGRPILLRAAGERPSVALPPPSSTTPSLETKREMSRRVVQKLARSIGSAN
eukprot:scaffold92593_cov51-Phaeocystis_antarctica.AAC.3